MEGLRRRRKLVCDYYDSQCGLTLVTNRIPGVAQVSKLRSLMVENIDVTDAEIAAWQQA